MAKKRANPLGPVIAVGTALAAVLGGIAAWWQFEGHWQTADEAKSHAQKDDVRFMWGQVGTLNLRAQFMEDRVYDCSARKATGTKMTLADASICERYQSEFAQAQQQVSDLRKQINEASKAKQ